MNLNEVNLQKVRRLLKTPSVHEIMEGFKCRYNRLEFLERVRDFCRQNCRSSLPIMIDYLYSRGHMSQEEKARIFEPKHLADYERLDIFLDIMGEKDKPDLFLKFIEYASACFYDGVSEQLIKSAKEFFKDDC